MPAAANITITAYLRSYTPVSEPQNDVIETLDRLARHDVIADYDVEWVPKSVRRDGALTTAERVYRRCTAWANDRGVDVSRPFDIRRYENTITGETVDRLVTPIVCLTVYENDDLTAVLPCEIGDRSISVLDYLTALEMGEDLLGTLTDDRTVAVA